MRRSSGRLFISLALLYFIVTPVTTIADALPDNVIHITATVVPARTIIINKIGQITKIYSNTSQSVTPVVHLDKLNGTTMPLTKPLLKQYSLTLGRSANTVGVITPLIKPQTNVSHTTMLQAMLQDISIISQPR